MMMNEDFFCANCGHVELVGNAQSPDKRLCCDCYKYNNDYMETESNEDKPKTEKWYVWREHKTVEGEETPRLLMPWSDEEVYEHPMNWQFKTIAEAEEAKSEFAPDEDWYLVLETSEVVKRYTPEPCRYCGGNCPREEDNCCDGYSGNIDNLYE